MANAIDEIKYLDRRLLWSVGLDDSALAFAGNG